VRGRARAFRNVGPKALLIPARYARALASAREFKVAGSGPRTEGASTGEFLASRSPTGPGRRRGVWRNLPPTVPHYWHDYGDQGYRDQGADENIPVNIGETPEGGIRTRN
jgi:hypothetical protein